MPDTHELMRYSAGGVQYTAGDATTYKLPTIPTGIASYAHINHTAGALRKMRVRFRKWNPGTLAYDTPTITVTDDGSTGHAAVPIANFATGAVTVLAAYANITATVAGSWTVTSPVFSVAIGSGTAGAAASLTLTGAAANLLPSSAITLASRTGNVTIDNVQGTGAITDSTGGTASTTWLTLSDVSATYNSAYIVRIGTALAQIAASLNKFSGTRALTIDGTSTAAVAYLNFGVNSDPGASGNTFTIGADSYVDIWYIFTTALPSS